MNKVIVKKIKFTSYMKMALLMSLSFGIVVGIFGFIIGIFDGPVYVNLGANEYVGFWGGVLGLIFFPLMFTIYGAISGLLIFLPFKLLLKVMKGISLYLEVEEEGQNEVVVEVSSEKLG